MVRKLMEIHLVSSLTPDDESRLAPSVLAAIEGVLGSLPVSYSLRIVTALGNSIQHNHTAQEGDNVYPVAATADVHSPVS
jgi:hypothetical protein